MQIPEYTVEELDKFAEEKLDNLETATAGCFTFNILTGASATVIIVFLCLIVTAIIYFKWFRGKIKFPKLRLPRRKKS